VNLALPLLLIFADRPSARLAVGRVHDLATLTHPDAERLKGRRLLRWVNLDSTADEQDGFTLYDAAGPISTPRHSGVF
jgi:hypothetical protein